MAVFGRDPNASSRIGKAVPDTGHLPEATKEFRYDFQIDGPVNPDIRKLQGFGRQMSTIAMSIITINYKKMSA